jgi:hypothetical protein
MIVAFCNIIRFSFVKQGTLCVVAVRMIRSKQGYFADRLYHSMKVSAHTLICTFKISFGVCGTILAVFLFRDASVSSGKFCLIWKVI